MSTIEWTNETWNPVTGCDRIDAACDHCYAMALARRLKGMGNPRYQRDGNPHTSGPGFGVTLHPDLLTKPFAWKKPKMVFVNSMSDLFHAHVPEAFIAQMFETMEAAPWHTFQVLTKRIQRARKMSGRLAWPTNVWMGTSIGTQDRIRNIAELIRIPAAIRFLSLEPLLEPLPHLPLDGIHWVIVGGESGPGARPCDLDWIRDIRDQCHAVGVPVFIKQVGRVLAQSRKKGAAKGQDMTRWPDDLRVREMPA